MNFHINKGNRNHLGRPLQGSQAWEDQISISLQILGSRQGPKDVYGAMPSGCDTAAVTICRDFFRSGYNLHVNVYTIYFDHWLQLLSSPFIRNLDDRWRPPFQLKPRAQGITWHTIGGSYPRWIESEGARSRKIRKMLNFTASRIYWSRQGHL